MFASVKKRYTWSETFQEHFVTLFHGDLSFDTWGFITLSRIRKEIVVYYGNNLFETSELNHIKCFEPFMQSYNLLAPRERENEKFFVSMAEMLILTRDFFIRRLLWKNGSFTCLDNVLCLSNISLGSLRLFAVCSIRGLPFCLCVLGHWWCTGKMGCKRVEYQSNNGCDWGYLFPIFLFSSFPNPSALLRLFRWLLGGWEDLWARVWSDMLVNSTHLFAVLSHSFSLSLLSLLAPQS